MNDSIDLDKDGIKNFALEVAKGNVPNASIIQLTGRNANLGQEFEEIWGGGELYTLDYDTQTANFTVGLTITGGTSTATAVIVADVDNGATGTLYLRDVNIADFQDNEIITDTSTGSATTNEPVTAKQNKIKGRNQPTAGQRWEVVCENSLDNSAGNGARTIVVEFMEEGTREYTAETINLNGHTPVALISTDAYRFRRAICSSWGAQTPSVVFGKTNLGTIIIRDSVTKDVMGVINLDTTVATDVHGLNNSLNFSYTIPANHSAYPVFVVTNTTKNNDLTSRTVVTLDGAEGVLTVGEISAYENSFVESLGDGPSKILEKTDVKFIAKSENITSVANVQAVLILIKDA